MFYVAGNLDGHGALGPACAKCGISVPAMRQYPWHSGERQHVINDGRFAKQAF